MPNKCQSYIRNPRQAASIALMLGTSILDHYVRRQKTSHGYIDYQQLAWAVEQLDRLRVVLEWWRKSPNFASDAIVFGKQFLRALSSAHRPASRGVVAHWAVKLVCTHLLSIVDILRMPTSILDCELQSSLAQSILIVLGLTARNASLCRMAQESLLDLKADGFWSQQRFGALSKDLQVSWFSGCDLQERTLTKC